MSNSKTLTFAFMDPPFESERTVTFFDCWTPRWKKTLTFACLPTKVLSLCLFPNKPPHGNAVHGLNREEESHPLSKDWVAALQQKATDKGLTFEWINCGLCVDERGVNDVIDGCGRGGPPDLWRYASKAFNTLTIGTR